MLYTCSLINNCIKYNGYIGSACMDRFHFVCMYISHLLQFQDKICGVASLLNMIVANIDPVQVYNKDINALYKLFIYTFVVEQACA